MKVWILQNDEINDQHIIGVYATRGLAEDEFRNNPELWYSMTELQDVLSEHEIINSD